MGRTICNVYFNELTLRDKILAQGGGAAAIEAKGSQYFGIINGASGIYASQDDYGTSYYYRGTKTGLNNNLIFAGMQWKIIRINGDGSVRLIYNGECPNDTCTINSTGTTTQIGTYRWSDYNNDYQYFGYMYGETKGGSSTSRAQATSNVNSIYIKTVLDNWYVSKFQGNLSENKIVDNLFCNDRKLQSEEGGESTGPGYGKSQDTYYAAYYRLAINRTPTLRCGRKGDRFTVNDTIVGNGTLTYPVGLITADEASMAGLVIWENNTTNYLYTNQKFFTISPFYGWFSGPMYMGSVGADGTLNNDLVGNTIGIRPVISINGDVKITGTGSTSDPFKVIF